MDNSGRRYSPSMTYQTSEQWNADVSAATGPPPIPRPTRFEEFMRQLKEQNAQQEQQTATGASGNSSFAPIALAPTIKTEEMAILRDSVVFTPPPEAQRAHMAATRGHQGRAGVEVSPERPPYSPLTDAGGADI
jgi:hypothetical protein